MEDAFRKGEPVSWERRLVAATARFSGRPRTRASSATCTPGGAGDGRGAGHHRSGAARRGPARVRARIVDAGARERLGSSAIFTMAPRTGWSRSSSSSDSHEMRSAPARARAGSTSHRRRARRSRNSGRSGTASTPGAAYGRSCEALRSLAARCPAARSMAVDAWAATRRRSRKPSSSACAKRSRTWPSMPAPTRTSPSAPAPRGSFELEVVDDGPGFDPRERSDGFGLASMRDRIAAIGGEFETIAAPGQGARIRASSAEARCAEHLDRATARLGTARPDANICSW